MKIVILGLSITSTWGNGHATTYRSLVRALSARKHDVLFLERDVEWYANQREMAEPPFCQLGLYKTFADLRDRFRGNVRSADLVMVGSYVPEGVAVTEWVTRNAHGPVAFYDIDTPVTVAKLVKGDHEYLSPDLIPRFDLYLSFTGGPFLDQLGSRFGARMVRPLYCSADPDIYMVEAGFSPSVRLFEAAACGIAIISDRWAGLEIFFEPGTEILVVASSADVLDIIGSKSDDRSAQIGRAARERFLKEHTPDHRAAELESYVAEVTRSAAAA